jgi:pyruvate formate lyase activating enzyme
MGCTLSCLWCSNPETIPLKPQIGRYPAKCLSREKCDLCVGVCPENGAPLEFDEAGILKGLHVTSACADCFKCVDACPPEAIKFGEEGELMTVDEMMKVILEDRSFYLRTGGGVTLNGGEVLVQWEVAAMLLEACKIAGINTCVETALNVPTEHMEAVFRFTDLVITDIKHMDTKKHEAYTGAGNERILKNIIRTAELGKKIVIRPPVIPGDSSAEENIRAAGAFIRDALGGNIVQYQLLPFRKMGTEKYDSLGIAYPMNDYQAPERSEWEQNLLHLADLLAGEYGLPAVAGSSQKLNI